MQSHADAGSPAATAPSSPTSRLTRSGDDDDDGVGGVGSGHFFFFSAPASPVHYILRSPPSSTAAFASTTTMAHCDPAAEGDYGCGGAGDFEFAARQHGAGDGATAMSSAEELFVAGRIRVGCLSPIRQEETVSGEQEEEDDCDHGDDDGEGEGRVGGGQRPRPRRARSSSPPRSPHLAKITEPSDSFASASSSSSSSTSSSLSSAAKNTRRRISLRDLLLGGTANNNDSATAAGPSVAERSSGFWPPSIWPSSRSKKTATLALPCPCPAPLQPARRSTSSDRSSAPRRRTTSLPYRQGLVLGCLGFGARSYGLAKSLHPLSSR